ncbi:MAG: ATP-binding cassette domain-containing protein [Candidatus Omnitrophica bacterium]|nr:ATP-binding cassette domain-containing protein [Candidatus Omnitrophota bacterium]
MTIGVSISYIGILFIVFRALTGLINQINGLNRILASVTRTNEILNAPSDPSHFFIKKNIEKIESIKLEDIYFKYRDDNEYLIKGFSYEFEKGVLYAIKGRSGIGKSTLIRLILGIIPPEKGKIFVNEYPLNEVRLYSFWEKIGYLPQEPFLFKGTIVENLSPNFQIKEDMIRKAMLKAGLNPIVFQNKNIEEGGKNLSGGEKRRISLARAFLKEPDVLILDEPITYIDMETEKIIIESILATAKEGKIVIAVTHNQNILNNADKIIDIDIVRQEEISINEF